MPSFRHHVDRVQAGEDEAELFPNFWNSNYANRNPGIIFGHSNGAEPTDINSSTLPGLGKLCRFLARNGYPVFGTDGGGPSTYGNNTAITRLGQIRTFAQQPQNPLTGLGWRSGKVILLSTSMSGLSNLTFARQNPTLVQCVLAFLPAISLNDLYQNDRGGSRALIEAAYGIVFPAAVPVENDPWQNQSATYPPVGFWYAGDDNLALPQFASGFAPASFSVNVGNFGHTDTTIQNINHQQVLDFVRSTA